MIIKFYGEMTLQQLGCHLYEVIRDISKRADLGIDANGVKVRDIQLGAVFNINGEHQYLTVDHDGLNEIFQVNVQLDKDGEIKKAVDNEKESFLDEYSKAVAKGEEKEYSVIESVYDSADLIQIDELNGGDIVEKTFKHAVTEETVIQYYKNGKLIGEMGMAENEPLKS